MSDVFQEIDEEVRQDQLKELWDRWGVILVVSVVSIILAWTGWILWRDHVEETRNAESTAFEAAVLQAGDSGLAALEALATTAEPGYAAISTFHRAGLLLAQNQPEAAIAVYDGVEVDDAASARLQGLASLMAAMVLADMEQPDEARARLQPLAVDGGAWALAAREMLALLDFRVGDLDAAESAFNALSTDAGTPGAMRQRSREMLDLIDSRRALVAPAAITVPDAAEAEEQAPDSPAEEQPDGSPEEEEKDPS